MRLLGVTLVPSTFVGCASRPVNAPIEGVEPGEFPALGKDLGGTAPK